MPHASPAPHVLPAARPRLPADLARRIDRLARRAHAFHRWAHHPLCPCYAPELIALGRRRRICRGCTYSALGLLLGAGVGACWQGPAAASWTGLGLAVLIGVASLRRRLPKLLGRLAPALLYGWALWGGWPVAVATVTVLGAGVAVYRRRGPDRTACVSCPENELAVCAGVSPMVRRERAFQRLAARWMRQSQAGSIR